MEVLFLNLLLSHYYLFLSLSVLQIVFEILMLLVSAQKNSDQMYNLRDLYEMSDNNPQSLLLPIILWMILLLRPFPAQLLSMNFLQNLLLFQSRDAHMFSQSDNCRHFLMLLLHLLKDPQKTRAPLESISSFLIEQYVFSFL